MECLPYFGNSIVIERENVRIYSNDALAFMHCYTRISGSNTQPASKQPWCRTTVCYRKIEQQWLVAHEHISMPVDFEKNSPVLMFDDDIQE